MKHVILTIVAAVGFTTAATAQITDASANPNAANIKFTKDTHDFGTIKNGADATYEFEFSNTGKEPLIIQEAKGSCGCTVPEYPKEPIMPGKTAKIKVTYDSKRTGEINKYVTVTSNAKNSPTQINIRGKVLAPDAK